MLDKYSTSQPIAYKILKNATKNEAYSHAYLFETGGFSDSLNLVYSFIQSILCPHKYTDKENCIECKTCAMIKSGNFPEIKTIEAEGLWIKKDQLKDLQKEFSKKAVIGNKKIYIIKDAEKLNKQSANSILKFLEEPDNNIIAILLTENIYEVLPTIRSRCQILKLKESVIDKASNQEEKIKAILNIRNESEDNEKLEKAIEFINYYENHHKDTILYMNKLWNEYYKTKEDYLKGFEIFTLYYKDILNKKVNKKLEIFSESKEINKISEKNTIKEICGKINVVIKLKETIKYNVNLNLIMDKLIIELDGGMKNERSSRDFVWRR